MKKISLCFLIFFFVLVHCKNEKDNKNEILLRNLIYLGIFSYNSDSSFSKYALKDIDLNKYLGLWKEYKRIDNSFQFGLGKVTAEYKLLDGTTVSVKNTGFDSQGNPSIIEGIGIVKNPSVPGILKVSFFPFFYTDYYILKIDPDYKYVLVGGPVDSILWILTRDGKISEVLESEYTNYAKSLGYQTDKLKSY